MKRPNFTSPPAYTAVLIITWLLKNKLESIKFFETFSLPKVQVQAHHIMLCPFLRAPPKFWYLDVAVSLTQQNIECTFSFMFWFSSGSRVVVLNICRCIFYNLKISYCPVRGYSKLVFSYCNRKCNGYFTLISRLIFYESIPCISSRSFILL